MADTPEELKSEWGSLTSSEFQSNEKWWPDALNLRMLHQRHPGLLAARGRLRLPGNGRRRSTSTSSPATSTR